MNVYLNICCHREPVLTLVWRSPQGNATNQGIATPVCELARNDTVFLLREMIIYRCKKISKSQQKYR